MLHSNGSAGHHGRDYHHPHQHQHQQQQHKQQRLRRQAAALLRRALRFRTAADLACKVPLIVGAILALLVVNTVLQYAAGPALHHALPLQDGSRGSRSAAAASSGAQTPAAASSGGRHGGHGTEGVAADVLPGGADAELLCVDRRPACDTGQCSKVALKYQECKATCNGCEHLRAAIQADTGLQVRVVQQLSPCKDLHPSCAAWAHGGGKCDKEPKAMLELCQASCGFCLPQAASPLAAAAGGGGGVSQQPSGLLDECQDDINVCPYLASVGLCSSGSLWLETQCQRSCGHCTPGAAAAAAGGGSAAEGGLAAAAAELHGGGGGSTSEAGASSKQGSGAGGGGGAGLPTATAAAAAAAISDKVAGSGKPSAMRLYGKAAAGDAAFTSQALEEWPVVGCRDSVHRCPAWSKAGECARNADYMAIACKASCGNCATYQTRAPFALLQLSSGWAMPAVGFGTAGLGVGTAAAVEYAAAAGYRMFDTAESKDWYDEAAVGAGLAASKLDRRALFLTSKIHPRDLGANATLAAFERSLAKLRTSYLDLLLLHYPACFLSANCIPSPTQSWQESWGALEGLVRAGRVRSIGVSNFGMSQMQELLALATIRPAVLESRSDPFAVNHHLINLCLAHNITFVGYSTLGTQWINSPASLNPVFNSSLLQAVADRHPGKSVAQVVLRWALQKGQAVIPRSSSTAHIPENLELFDFALSDAEMQAMNGLDGTWKTGGLPLPVA